MTNTEFGRYQMQIEVRSYLIALLGSLQTAKAMARYDKDRVGEEIFAGQIEAVDEIRATLKF